MQSLSFVGVETRKWAILMSKLGFEVNGITDPTKMLAVFSYCQPRIVKSLHHDPLFWRSVKEVCPNTFLLGRMYVDKQPLDDPIQAAIKHAIAIKASSCAHIYDAWEGYNETPRDKLVDRCYFDIHMAKELHQDDIKYCCGSWSVGVPDIPDWLNSNMLDALSYADYVSCHEYCAPTMNDKRGLDLGGTEGWFTLRYRKWYLTLPRNYQKPLIISECGIDSGAAHWPVGAQGGWRSFTTPAGYLEQLRWYDSWLMADNYVLGACIYCWGTFDDTWLSYDISGTMVELIAEYIREEPLPPIPPDQTDLEGRVARVENKLSQIGRILSE